MKVNVKKLHPDAKRPAYATDGSGCFDLYAVLPKQDKLLSGYPLNIGTGLAFEIPRGNVMLVFSRSGHGFKNDVRLGNCVGVIDSDYRGELRVKLTSDNRHDQFLVVSNGDRIAQGLIVPYEQAQFIEAEELSETERGAGGFGSTGG